MYINIFTQTPGQQRAQQVHVQPRFCGLKGHELFAEVEEEYATLPVVAFRVWGFGYSVGSWVWGLGFGVWV